MYYYYFYTYFKYFIYFNGFNIINLTLIINILHYTRTHIHVLTAPLNGFYLDLGAI